MPKTGTNKKQSIPKKMPSTSKKKKEVKEVKEEKEVKEVKPKIEEDPKTDDTMVTFINTQELNSLIAEDLERDQKKTPYKKHVITTIVLIVMAILSVVYFAITLTDKSLLISSLIRNLLLTIFTILFVVISITYNRRSKVMILISTLFLIGYFIYGINQYFTFVPSPIRTIPNFSGKSITKVIQWASKNNIVIEQEYEYSDMIDEYCVIGQNIPVGTAITSAKEIVVSISEGPNPAKEIMVPSMIGWNDERVIQFILDNYLSNVNVEFVSSDQAENTVIEQSASGSLRRNDELKLTFSYGEELGFSEVKLIDFTNKTKFEVEFFMKQHHLRYEFSEDFDSNIKKGNAIKQSIEPGKTVHVDDEKISVTISKGPEIKVPNLLKYSMIEITEWAIQNRVKLKFSDGYDDTIKENQIISANYKEGDVIEQGTVVKVVISRGSLKMPKFNSLNDFYIWANKYNIQYEEQHEFSNTVEAGKVISYSYKVGEALKNNDVILVIISDGAKITVPNLIGLTKGEAISKLEKLGLRYSFTYRSSNSVSKDKVMAQSIQSGREISKGTTVTVTLSSGKASNNNNDNNNNDHSGDSGGNHNPEPEPEPEPEPNCEDITIYIDGSHIKSSPTATCSTIKSAYPKLKFSCSYVPDSGLANGMLKNSSSIDESTRSTCETVNLIIVDNN